MRVTSPVLQACLQLVLLTTVVTHARAQGRGAPAVGGSIEDGTLVFRSSDGAYEFVLDGRLQADAAVHAGEGSRFGNGTAIRRARIGVEALVHRTWEAGFDVDFAGTDVEIKDAWIGYTGLSGTLIRAGQFKEPFSLQTLTSSKDIMLMERAAIDELAPDRNIGLGASRWGTRWQASVGAFGESAAEPDDGNNEGLAVTGRITVAPLLGPRTVVHVGVSGSRRTPRVSDPASGRSVRVAVSPESGVAASDLLDTGDITFVRRADLFNTELAVVHGSLTLQGEFTHATLRRVGDRADVVMKGGYASASLFLTGDRRDYLVEDGEFDRVRPARDGGAWELLARYSTIDLTQASAGRATYYTAGMTWHININVRWMLNYSRVRTAGTPQGLGDAASRPDAPFHILQTRIALAF